MTPVRSTPAAQPMTAGRPWAPRACGRSRRAPSSAYRTCGDTSPRSRPAAPRRASAACSGSRPRPNRGRRWVAPPPRRSSGRRSPGEPPGRAAPAARRPGAGRGHRSGGASASGSPGRRRPDSRRRRAGCASQGGGVPLCERGSVGNVGGHEPKATAPAAGATDGAAEPPRLLREAGGPAMERARLEPGPRN